MLASFWMSPVKEEEDSSWLLAPVICAAILTLGVVAGVVSALRQGGRVEYAGIPLPRCKWLRTRCSVRVAAGISLLAGFAGHLSAFGHFVRGWHDDVPFYLMSLTLACYVLLIGALLLAFIGLQRKQTAPEVHEAFRQSAKAALLGGLAAGLAAEVLCNAGESQGVVPHNWRVGCGMLGASSGLLLLGLLAAQVDGQAGADTQATEESSTNGVCVDEDVEKTANGGRYEGSESIAATAESPGAENDSSDSLWPGCHPWPSWTAQEHDLDMAHPRQPQAQHLLHIPRPMAPAMGNSFQQPLLLQQPSESNRAQRSWPSAPRRLDRSWPSPRLDVQWPLRRNTSDTVSPWEAGCGVGSLDAGLRSVQTLMVR